MKLLSPLLLLNEQDGSCAWPFGERAAAPTVLEIGFGDGEYLVAQAARQPQKNFIGLEQNAERIQKTLKRIQKADGESPLSHVRVSKLDARFFLKRFVPQQAVDMIVCLFPCPWPKKKHHKFRLFCTTDLCLINSRLKQQGRCQIVTDHYPYYQWILEQLPGAGFDFSERVIEARFDTKFERKWSSAGQDQFFELNLTKVEHLDVAVEKAAPMKSYTIEGFNVDNFAFEDVTGPTTILFKEILFDPKLQKALVHLIVAEDPIKQHFWVAIAKNDKVWRVYKGDGQQIFQTKACARALDLVSQAAQKSASSLL